MHIQPDVLQTFKVRTQQITPCEAFCAVVVPFLHPHLFRHKDVIWFIDNQAALSSLIKGSSSQSDISLIATFAHLMFAVLGCRVYFEWVDSEANPSDGLSRDGVVDSWTCQQGWQVEFIPEFPWTQVVGLSFHEMVVFLHQHWGLDATLGKA
jgi:hypothetical protein